MNKELSTPARHNGDSEWFQDWFDEDYLALYKHRNSDEARKFLGNLRHKLSSLGERGTVDLACGAGRHSWLLSEDFDWPVVGLDLSEPLLRRAVNHQSNQPKLRPAFVRGDLRQLPFHDQSFHLALNIFTSFGYFSDDAQHLQSLEEMRRILVPGGMLVMDLMNPAVAVDNLVAEDETQSGLWRVKQTRRYDPETKRIEKTIELHSEDGKTRSVRESVRIFKLNELESIMAEAGLTITDTWGDYQASPFNPSTSERLISFVERT